MALSIAFWKLFLLFYILLVAEKQLSCYNKTTIKGVLYMDMQEKIKYLRKKYNLTLEDVAKKVGVSKSTVRKWELGLIANMRRDKIAKLAKALHTTPAYLMGWNEEEMDVFTIENISPIQKKSIPLLGEIACGEPIYADEQLGVFLEAGKDINADFCLIAKGDSMIGARIYNGDIVFIRKQEMVENGEIAAVLIEDEATLKRVYYDQQMGVLFLYPENPAFKTLRYTQDDLNKIHILGKAIAFQSFVK